MAIQYPIEISGIKWGEEKTIQPSLRKTGTMVRVRPCGEQYGDKTYLGILIGDVALTCGVNYNRETKELEVFQTMHNPAMFVPDLNEVIYGCGSWWGPIKSAEDLKDITDADISNQWYVKALEQIAQTENAKVDEADA